MTRSSSWVRVTTSLKSTDWWDKRTGQTQTFKHLLFGLIWQTHTKRCGLSSLQERVEQLPPSQQCAVAALPVLQAAVHEVPQFRKQGCQGHTRGAQSFPWQHPPVQLGHRGPEKLRHVSITQVKNFTQEEASGEGDGLWPLMKKWKKQCNSDHF